MSRPTTAPNRAREYETIYILRPDVDADNAEKLGTRIADVVHREAGRLTKVELWGRRRLAYDVGPHKRGVYVYLRYIGAGRTVAEIERNLRLADHVLKFQTVLVRNDVEAAVLQVADEDVKFERLELPSMDEERDDSRERQLGLVEDRYAAPPQQVEEDEPVDENPVAEEG